MMTLLDNGVHRGRGEAPDKYGGSRRAWHTTGRGYIVTVLGLVGDVTVLGLVGGAPGGETPRVADSSAAGAGGAPAC